MARNQTLAGMPSSAMMSSVHAYAAPFGGIRPTPAERLRGRLLRAPDHDASTPTPEPSAPAADAAPAAAPAGDPASTEQPAAPDAPAGETQTPAPGAETETSLLGGELKDKAEGEPKPDGEAAPEHVVPETYELTAEGIELDAAAIEAATPVFKELNLSNEQASKLMPVADKFREQVAGATLQQLVDAGAVQKAGWLKETRDHPEIGGGNLEQTLHLAGKAFDHFGIAEGSDFRNLLTETGFGNHPDMVRIMRGVGEMLSEDGFPRSGAGETKSDPLTDMYPNNRRSK